jgi:L-fucose mutarotase
MLKEIPGCISPELMCYMMQMGHGDELILADRDFPGHTFAKRVIRADGLSVATLLDAILKFFPLDPFVDKPVAMMAPTDEEPVEWAEFRKIVTSHDKSVTDFEFVERFEFYERTKGSFVVVVTGEPDGNVILKKGVV